MPPFNLCLLLADDSNLWEKLHAIFCQAAGGVHHLFFSFRRAGTCDDHGAHFLFAGQIQRGEIEFQSIIRFCGYLFLIIPLYMRET